MKFNFVTKQFCAILLVISFASSLIAFFYLKYSNDTSLNIFPSPAIKVEPVSDTWEGGNSWTHIAQNDSVITYSYIIRPGFKYPYAGIKMHLASSGSARIDFSAFDSLNISLKMSNSDAVRLFLKSYDPQMTNPSKPNSYWYHELEFVPDKKTHSAHLSLHDFTIPTWWRLQHSISEQKRPDKLNAINHLEILNGLSTSNQDTVFVSISSIVLTGNNKFVQKVIFSVVFVIWLITALALIIYTTFRWVKGDMLKLFRSNAHSAYKKVTLKSDDEEQRDRLVAHITEHYFDSNLTIENVAFKTGINRKSASLLIRKYLNTNFKGYLNLLRLNEASRLLKETDKQVTEIALSVGYNNVNHFSRIFKEKFSVSPKEYRGNCSNR